MTPQQFAQSIKAKYPQYQNVDDVELAQKMVAKYPQYASQVTFEQKKVEDPVKLWDTSGFKAGFTGIGKGIGKVALGVGTLGRSLQEGVARLAGKDLAETSIFDVGSEQRQQANQALAYNKPGEKIAGTITEIGATMLPSGAAYKATQGLGFAAKLFGRSATGALTGTIQGGGEVGKDTLIGAGTEAAFPLAGKAIGYGGNVLKGLAGLISGKGGDVIEQVIKTPRAALAGGKGEAPAVLRETATTIRTGIKTLSKKAGDEFASLTSGHTEQLNKKEFNTLVNNFLKDVNETSFIETSKLNKIKDVVKTWDDYSAQGINKLASKLSKFYSGSANAVDTDRVVSGLNRTIRDWVGKQVPDIAEANAKYANKMDLIEQMDAIFKTKGSVDDRLGMQKTAEAIGRLFNANKDIAREGVEELEKELGINVLGKEAGRQLVDGVTRSQGAIGDFATGVSKALIPPKLVLQLTASTGIAKEAIESRLNTLSPAARATTIEVLTDLFGTGETQDPVQPTQ